MDSLKNCFLCTRMFDRSNKYAKHFMNEFLSFRYLQKFSLMEAVNKSTYINYR